MGKDAKMDDPVKKGKKKMWKVCKCGFGWTIFGIVLLCIGIALLVNFAKFWGDNDEWERSLAYLGVAFILLGFLLLAAGITFCGILLIVYRRMTSDHSTGTMFRSPTFEYGQAPYPQQPPFTPTQSTGIHDSSNSGPAPAVDPSAPPALQSGEKPLNTGEVQVEISDHQRF